jgi:hypothetical protein
MGVAWRCVAAACIAMGVSQAQDPLAENLLPAVTVEGIPRHVWVTGSMAKIQPNASPGPAQFAELAAARNEFESFQIHVRASSQPIELQVTAGDFVNGRTGDRIPAERNVAVFREAYLNVTTVSDQNGISGLVPDGLIPGTDPYFHERRNGFPLTIPAGETRSVWIDVFVPPKTPSGYYVGTIDLSDGDKPIARVPARLKVWNFDIPSTATLRSGFGLGYPAFARSAYDAGRYPGTKGRPELGLPLMHAAVGAFFLDHRVSISEAVVKPTYPEGDWHDFDASYGALLNGQANTLLAGARLTSVDYANGGPNPSPNLADLKDWRKHFEKKSWLPRFMEYLCDEPPGGCKWELIGPAATLYHATAPGLKVLVTTDIALATQHGLLDAIDILVPTIDQVHPLGGTNQRPSYDDWLKRPGKELWWYQSCDQHGSCDNGQPGPKSSTWPSYMVDASPVRNRIFQWMAFLYGIQGELYYATDMWGDHPWDHLYYAGGNGDGALFYPWTAEEVGGSTPIPVASIRLKLIRGGMQDYEYLAALAKAGETQLVSDTLRSFITDATTFKDDPAALLAARDKLGTALHRRSLAR